MKGIFQTFFSLQIRYQSLLAIPKGAKGILIYPDLEEYAKSVPYQNTTYPGGPLLSPKAVMSAQMYTRYGDPLTPGFPSLDGIYRRKKTDIKDIPPILVQPISYGDARWLLQQMTGEAIYTSGSVGVRKQNQLVQEVTDGRVQLRIN